MKKLSFIIALATIVMLCCQCTTSKEFRQAKKGAKAIPYVVLNNYYVRNDIDCSSYFWSTFLPLMITTPL